MIPRADAGYFRRWQLLSLISAMMLAINTVLSPMSLLSLISATSLMPAVVADVGYYCLLLMSAVGC
jgi:hypothetical protein